MRTEEQKGPVCFLWPSADPTWGLTSRDVSDHTREKDSLLAFMTWDGGKITLASSSPLQGMVPIFTRIQRGFLKDFLLMLFCEQ